MGALNRIKITHEEMKYIALFESLTGASLRDCVVDEDGTILVTVKPEDVGLVIGRKGSNIRLLRNVTGRDIRVFEYHENPEAFVKNALKPARVYEVRIVERPDGSKVGIVRVDGRDKRIAIGRNGRRIRRVRLLSKRYFQLDNVVIV